MYRPILPEKITKPFKHPYIILRTTISCLILMSNILMLILMYNFVKIIKEDSDVLKKDLNEMTGAITSICKALQPILKFTSCP